MKKTRLVYGLGCMISALAMGSLAKADGGADLVQSMSGVCVASLVSGTDVGPGLTRAEPAMESKLLNGKQGKIWRTENPKIVIVAHTSGDTCEVMGLGILPSEFSESLQVWLREDGQSFKIDPGHNMQDTTPGGAYLAQPLDDGGFVQMFIQTHPETRFVGITVARVEDSVQARELLGE